MMRLARIEEDAKQQDQLAAFEVQWACWLERFESLSARQPLTRLGMQTKQQQLQAADDARTAKNRSKRLKRKVCAWLAA